MKKKLFILIICSLLANVAWAGEFSSLENTWEAERDAATVQVVRMWLSGSPEPPLQKEIVRFLDREVKLSIISSETRLLVSDPGFDAQQIPASLFMIILRQNGVSLDPENFFAGKRFYVLSPQ